MAQLKRARRAGLSISSLLAFLLVSGCGIDMNAPVFSQPGGQATQTPTRTATPDAALTPAGSGSILSTPTGTRVPTESVAASISTNTPSDPTRFSVSLKLDTLDTHPISPYIYGVADAGSGDSGVLGWLGTTLVRWGGNARSRFNWELNTSNGGVDNNYTNVSKGDAKPGSASLAFLQRNMGLGARSLLTIPTIGWVAKDSKSRSVNVPEHGGPPVSKGSDVAYTQASDGAWAAPYDPSENRALTSLPSFPSKGAPFVYPPDLTDGKVYQDEWVAYLRGQRKSGELPPIYAMDNEPDLWADNTHTDVHPVRMGYDDMLSNFLSYARAVKKADPEGLVAGPESWGFTGYYYSALDEGGDGFKTSADQVAHGNVPFTEWFLRSLRAKDKEAGSRSLDVLSLHYYSSTGVYQGDNKPATQDKRMQAPRALWDGLYVEPGWVSRTEWANLALLPRMNQLIAANYPGTKLGLTEWNFGGENDISGAIATADTLGILGREGAYLASYWGVPEKNSATGWAFRLFRNYDGKGSQFGSQSVKTDSSNTESFSAYSALNEDRTALTVMLINKSRTRRADVQMAIRGFVFEPEGMQYSLGAKDPNSISAAPLTLTGSTGPSVTLPPMSISLVVLNLQK